MGEDDFDMMIEAGLEAKYVLAVDELVASKEDDGRDND